MLDYVGLRISIFNYFQDNMSLKTKKPAVQGSYKQFYSEILMQIVLLLKPVL